MTRKKTEKTVVWAKTSRRRRRKQPFIVCWPTTHTQAAHCPDHQEDHHHSWTECVFISLDSATTTTTKHTSMQSVCPVRLFPFSLFSLLPSFGYNFLSPFPFDTCLPHQRTHTNWEKWKRLETREKEAEAPATPAHFALSYKADRHRRGGVVNSSGSHYSTTTTRQCNAMAAHSVTLCLFLDRSRTEERRAGQLFGGAWTELVC